MPVSFPFISVFAGDETISRDKARDDLVGAFVKEHGPPGEERFDAGMESVVEFVNRILTPSLFDPFRFFFIPHAQTLSTEELAAISTLFDCEVPDAFLILIADECRPAAGRSDLPKAFDAWLKDFERHSARAPHRFMLKQFAKPRDYEIAGWLMNHAHLLFKRRMTQEDAEFFVDLVGYDFDRIYSELRKLDIYLDEGKAFDRAAIGEVIDPTRTMNVFELAQALGRKNLQRALVVVDSLFGGQFPASQAIWALYQHFWLLYKIRAFRRLNPGRIQAFTEAAKARNRDVQNKAALEIAVAVGIITEKQTNRLFPAVIKPGLIEQALDFSDEDLRAILRWLRDYDLGIKTGILQDTKGHFQALCHRIARAGVVVETLE